MILADETIPFSIPSMVPRFAEWDMPASSAWMIRYRFASVSAPQRGADQEGNKANVKINGKEALFITFIPWTFLVKLLPTQKAYYLVAAARDQPATVR
jgi:hypothetical protein